MTLRASIAKYSVIAFVAASLLIVGGLSAQTTVSSVANQAKAVYKYRTFPPDTISSNIVQFSILAVPNFELHFASMDSMVFGKETLAVRLVYTNVGNTAADTATIVGTLPPAGLRFVPSSTGGAVSGRTVTWKVLNVAAGNSDSVSVRVVVDSTLTAGTQVAIDGKISWLTSSTSVTKTFAVGNFPRLEVSNSPQSPFVGSGREVIYTVKVKNTGNTASTSTILLDSISSYGRFVRSSDEPSSISGDGRVVRWSLGTIPAFSEKSVTVTVGTTVNLLHEQLATTAQASASNIASGASAVSTIEILPIVPKHISITATPPFIFGQVDQDSARIDVTLTDSLENVLPDGVPVHLTASFGSFNNGTGSIDVVLQNGIASVYLRSGTVQNQIVTSSVSATGGMPQSGTQKDSVRVLMYPGAVTGIVINGLDHKPYQGAIARVYNGANAIVGVDTSESDGKFFIPLNKDVTAYTLDIIVVDKFGDTLVSTAKIDPTAFPIPPIAIPNVISGRIIHEASRNPVPAEGITVYLDSVQERSNLIRGRRVLSTLPTGLGPLTRVSEQRTDFKGRFKFENLRPAVYVVSVDSNQFPNFKGSNILSDTISGSFTFNLSIEIQQDSMVTFVMEGAPSAAAGDTLRYRIATRNTGNFLHTNVTVTDSLPAFTKFVAAAKGSFSTVAYDSAAKTVQWMRDSLPPNNSDSVSLTLVLTRNIPDSTPVINASRFRSDVGLDLSRTTTTVVRSAPEIFFTNIFVGRDSVVAGDSLRKVLIFGNSGTDSLHDVMIVDTVFNAGMSKMVLAPYQSDSVMITDSIVTIVVGAIPPGTTDSVLFTLKTDFGLAGGTAIRSHASLQRGDSTILQRQATVTMIDNPLLSSYLKVLKTANKKVAEIGDIVTYQVQISNTSPSFVHSVGLYDLLPHAFRYVKRSARFNGVPVEPTINPNLNALTWTVPDTITAGSGAVLVYQLAIGADALESQGMNTAYASAVASVGSQLVSAPSQWQVTVRPGVFTEKGLIIGKVFYDDNRNTFQESGETGIKNVELWMEDGTKIVTGDDGKFSLPEVKPGQHVLRVNERTLPAGAVLLGGAADFAGDPLSRFVRVTESGIAKANFFVKRNLRDSIRQKVGTVRRLIGVRQAKPKFVYRDTLLAQYTDTVEMVVSFAYNGPNFAQRMVVQEVLPAEFRIIPGTATYNGRTVEPIVYGTSVEWNLGRAPQRMNGTLRYRVWLTSVPKEGAPLLSVSTISLMTPDSVTITSERLITENVVRDPVHNRIETSEIRSTVQKPEDLTSLKDSVSIAPGDEAMFGISVYVDPNKKIASFSLFDSLESSFLINERSFTINGVPVPQRLLSVRVRSSAYTSRGPSEKREIEFFRIAELDLTNMIRAGLNEITYTARLQDAGRDSLFRNSVSASITDIYGEVSRLHSDPVTVRIRHQVAPLAVSIDTVLPPSIRPATWEQQKSAVAARLIRSLKDRQRRTIVMEGITFENGKTTLTDSARAFLDDIATQLRQEQGVRILIGGYTDNTGNSKVNLDVSQARANAVRSYLIGKGIPSARLEAKGFGSDNPIATNKTEAGRSKNRRVEFVPLK